MSQRGAKKTSATKNLTKILELKESVSINEERALPITIKNNLNRGSAPDSLWMIIKLLRHQSHLPYHREDSIENKMGRNFRQILIRLKVH